MDIFRATTLRDFNARLGTLMEFGPEELSANRGGELTRKQKRKFMREALRPAVQAAAGSLSIIVSSAVVRALTNPPEWVHTATWVLSGLALFAGIFLTTRALALFALDMKKGPVEMEEGRLHPSWENGGRTFANDRETGSRFQTNCYFVVAGESFRVNQRAHAFLADSYEFGLPAGRIYYLPVSRQILSVDILEMSPTAQQLQQQARNGRGVAAMRASIGMR